MRCSTCSAAPAVTDGGAPDQTITARATVPSASRRRSPPRLLTGLGAILLLGSLFLTWSHQLSRGELGRFAGAALYGVAREPTAFQVYAVADLVLAALAIGIAAAGLLGRRPIRAAALGAALVGLAFVSHAAVSAPTNGVLLAQGSGPQARYYADPATAGVGETVAIVGLACAATGLAAGLVVPQRPSSRPGTGRVAA